MKKILPFLMILMMLFAFVACDNGNGDNPNPDAPSVSDPTGTDGGNPDTDDDDGNGNETTKYTVTYTVSPEGLAVNLPTSEEVNEGTVLNHADLSREYYVFDGWFIGDEKISFPYTVNSDVTITAKFTDFFSAAEESATIPVTSKADFTFSEGDWVLVEKGTAWEDPEVAEIIQDCTVFTVTGTEDNSPVTEILTSIIRKYKCESEDIYNGGKDYYLSQEGKAETEGFIVTFDDNTMTITLTATAELIEKENTPDEDVKESLTYSDLMRVCFGSEYDTIKTNTDKTVLILTDEDESYSYKMIFVKQ